MIVWLGAIVICWRKPTVPTAFMVYGFMTIVIIGRGDPISADNCIYFFGVFLLAGYSLCRAATQS